MTYGTRKDWQMVHGKENLSFYVYNQNYCGYELDNTHPYCHNIVLHNTTLCNYTTVYIIPQYANGTWKGKFQNWAQILRMGPIHSKCYSSSML